MMWSLLHRSQDGANLPPRQMVAVMGLRQAQGCRGPEAKEEKSTGLDTSNLGMHAKSHPIHILPTGLGAQPNVAQTGSEALSVLCT